MGELRIVDRDPARARALVSELQARYGPARVAAFDDISASLSGASGLVHATPTGMAKLPGLPLPLSLLRPDLWVFEIVYFPQQTTLLEAARLKSPNDGNGRVFLQLMEPDAAAAATEEQELFQPVGLGTAAAAVSLLRQRWLQFVDSADLQVTTWGAITHNMLQTVVFELVHGPRH